MTVSKQLLQKIFKKENIPAALILSRLGAAFFILLLSIISIEKFSAGIVLVIIYGLLSDVFDGIIARKMNISSVKLRTLDSGTDQIFWITVIIAAFISGKTFFLSRQIEIFIVIFLEILAYVISFVKFKKSVATHAIASKIWTLLLFAAMIEIILTHRSSIFFEACIIVGIITRIEIIAILLILKKWETDIPSVFHAIKIGKGIPIKRSKIFNG